MLNVAWLRELAKDSKVARGAAEGSDRFADPLLSSLIYGLDPDVRPRRFFNAPVCVSGILSYRSPNEFHHHPATPSRSNRSMGLNLSRPPRHLEWDPKIDMERIGFSIRCPRGVA